MHGKTRAMECISIRRPWGSGEGTMISPLWVNATAPEDFPGVIQLLILSMQVDFVRSETEADEV